MRYRLRCLLRHGDGSVEVWAFTFSTRGAARAAYGRFRAGGWCPNIERVW